MEPEKVRQERAAFEKWATTERSIPEDIRGFHRARYMNVSVQAMYESWLARAAYAQSAAPTLKPQNLWGPDGHKANCSYGPTATCTCGWIEEIERRRVSRRMAKRLESAAPPAERPAATPYQTKQTRLSKQCEDCASQIGTEIAVGGEYREAETADLIYQYMRDLFHEVAESEREASRESGTTEVGDDL